MFLYGTFILALHQCFEVYLVNWKVIVVPFVQSNKKYLGNAWNVCKKEKKRKVSVFCTVSKNEPFLIHFWSYFSMFLYSDIFPEETVADWAIALRTPLFFCSKS